MTTFVTVEQVTRSSVRRDVGDIINAVRVLSLNTENVEWIAPGVPMVRIVDGEDIQVATTNVRMMSGAVIIVVGKHSRLFYDFMGQGQETG